MATDGMVRLHTLRRGVPGSLPLVLLHGFPLDHRMWLDVTDLLAGDRTVIAPDLPGFGTSPTGPDVAASLGTDPSPSLDVMADGVVAALRAAGVTRAVVAGLSMGGYVAMSIVERHPELVAGLALIDTKSTADDDAARDKRLAIADTVVAELRVDAVFGMRTSVLGATNRIARPDLVERIERWIRDQGPHAVAWAQRAMAARPDRTDVLAGYSGPSVVVVGDEDELSPVPAAEHMAAALQRTGPVVIAGAGHMTSNESPEPVASALAALLQRAEDRSAA